MKVFAFTGAVGVSCESCGKRHFECMGYSLADTEGKNCVFVCLKCYGELRDEYKAATGKTPYMHDVRDYAILKKRLAGVYKEPVAPIRSIILE